MPRPRYHLLCSTAIGLALGGGLKLPAALASGFFIDFDHFFDYFAGRRHRIVLPLHAWELLPLWAAIDRRLGLGGALAASYFAHMVMDQIWNERRSALAYSLVYRAAQGFREDQLGPLDPDARHEWRRTSLLGLLRWF